MTERRKNDRRYITLKLNPCPCGCKDIIINEECIDEEKYGVVQCLENGCRCIVRAKNLDQAIAMWNGPRCRDRRKK